MEYFKKIVEFDSRKQWGILSCNANIIVNVLLQTVLM